jgi:hypothetical protein
MPSSKKRIFAFNICPANDPECPMKGIEGICPKCGNEFPPPPPEPKRSDNDDESDFEIESEYSYDDEFSDEDYAAFEDVSEFDKDEMSDLYDS